MKRFFKIGLSIIIPFLLVIQIFYWFYNFVYNIIIDYLPHNMEYQWWYAIIAVLGVLIVITIIGMIFNLIAPIRWLKNRFDKYIVDRIPIVNKIYNFGKDISDSFISDIKEDGDLKVVEVMFAGQMSLGVLTDESNDIVFVPTAPNPLNGFIMKTKDYKKMDMSFTDLIQSLASLGKVNGSKWKEKRGES
jgi:uncharacterized membrane protein